MLGEAGDVLGWQGGGQLQKLVGEEQWGHRGVQPARERPRGFAPSVARCAQDGPSWRDPQALVPLEEAGVAEPALEILTLGQKQPREAQLPWGAQRGVESAQSTSEKGCCLAVPMSLPVGSGNRQPHKPGCK